MASTVRKTREERREQVLAAAREEFAHAGMQGSVDLVAERAGVTAYYLLRLFGTKKVLFDAGSDLDVFKDARMQAAERLVAILDARDAYVGRHSARVARLVEALGHFLGLDEQEVRQLRLAGLLHDLGKIAVPDTILGKPAPLDAWERQLVRKHPQTGFDLLDGLDLAPVDTWVLHHHEHWDGRGYPHGLAGEQIPFGSRLILVADAFEAMTTERSYNRALSVEEATAELRDKAGTQFDPGVVAAFTSYLFTIGLRRKTGAPTRVPARAT